MRKVNLSLCGRLVLAFLAVFAIVGSGGVFAASPSYPAPEFASIIGSGMVSVGTSSNYTLYVTFVNNTSANIAAPNCTFFMGVTPASTYGSFTTGTGTYNAPIAAPPNDKTLLKATFASAGASVLASRVIIVQ